MSPWGHVGFKDFGAEALFLHFAQREILGEKSDVTKAHQRHRLAHATVSLLWMIFRKKCIFTLWLQKTKVLNVCISDGWNKETEGMIPCVSKINHQHSDAAWPLLTPAGKEASSVLILPMIRSPSIVLGHPSPFMGCAQEVFLSAFDRLPLYGFNAVCKELFLF